MSDVLPIRRIVEFEFSDADAAAQAIDTLNLHVAQAAHAVGATVARQEFAISNTSDDDPTGELLAEFEAHINPYINLFDPEFQSRLDTPLRNVLLHDGLDTEYKKQCSRMLGHMQKNAITSVRDVIVRGTSNLLDIRGLGHGFIDTLRAELNAYVPELPLLSASSPIITARFCETLDQIVLLSRRERISMAELLTDDEQNLAARLETDAAGVSYCRYWAQQYTNEFRKAKAMQKLRDL